MIFEDDDQLDNSNQVPFALGGGNVPADSPEWSGQPDSGQAAEPIAPSEKIGPVSEPVMHTMPGRFLSKGGATGKKRSSKKIIIWGVIIFVVLASLILVAIILFNRAVNTNTNTNTNTETNANTNSKTEVDQDKVTSLIDADSALTDSLLNDKCISSADEQVSGHIKEMIEIRKEQINTYSANQSGYSLSMLRTSYPSGTFLSTLKIYGQKHGYTVPDMTDFWYVSLSFSDTCNKDLEAWLDLDQPDQIASGELHEPDVWIMTDNNANQNANSNENANSNANQNANTNTNLNTNAAVTDSLDSDNDGLTDTEEVIYSTQENLPDTDSDGYSDGSEVLNGYNPRGSGKLVGSDLVETYTNDVYNYSIVYPRSFLAQPTSQETKKEVLFTATNGEFIDVTQEDNPSKLSLTAWFMARSPSVDISTLESVTINGLNGIISPNKLTIYLGKDDKIYVIKYDYGNKSEINFRTTFQMMYKSFQLVASQINTNTNSNSNINQNTNTNSNSNINQNTNTNSNSNNNTNASINVNANTNTNSNTNNTNTYTNSNTNASVNTNLNSNSNTNTNINPNSNSV